MKYYNKHLNFFFLDNTRRTNVRFKILFQRKVKRIKDVQRISIKMCKQRKIIK